MTREALVPPACTVVWSVVENGLHKDSLPTLQIPRVVGRLVDSIWGLLGDCGKTLFDRDFMTISLTQLALN